MQASDLIKSSLALFNAVPVKDSKGFRIPSENLIESSVSRGFIFSPVVCGNYSDVSLLTIMKENRIGISGKEANSSFHKSWEKIANASIERLVAEQLVHYFSTYGLEFFGVIGNNSPDNPYVYLPLENLNIPNTTKLELKVIRGITLEELKQKCLNLLYSGIALKQETLDLILTIFRFTKINSEDLEGIKNREFLAVLYDEFRILPKNVSEFLRYLIYKASEKTLLIKDRKTIQVLKDNSHITNAYLHMYVKEYGIEAISTQFFRYKPLWLALKNRDTAYIINRARKLAERNNIPTGQQMLDTLTSLESTRENVAKVEKLLNNITVFRKLRIMQALNSRIKGGSEALYRIRNGKMYVTDREPLEDFRLVSLTTFFHQVVNSIRTSNLPHLYGKTVYVPNNIEYGLPTSEKQFVFNIPSGTKITSPKDMVVGVYWNNLERMRIDLDFKMVGLFSTYGWDASFRNPNRTVLFSGDMTDARNGASELFYIKGGYDDVALFTLNYFNYSENPVPAKLVLANETPPKGFTEYRRAERAYMVNPENIISSFDITVTEKETLLGFVMKSREGLEYYFIDGSLANRITSRRNEHTTKAIKYLQAYYRNMISLNSLLYYCGAKFVDSPDKADIDLSVEKLERDTILNLFNKE